jgi:hypothetical protein
LRESTKVPLGSQQIVESLRLPVRSVGSQIHADNNLSRREPHLERNSGHRTQAEDQQAAKTLHGGNKVIPQQQGYWLYDIFVPEFQALRVHHLHDALTYHDPQGNELECFQHNRVETDRVGSEPSMTSRFHWQNASAGSFNRKNFLEARLYDK